MTYFDILTLILGSIASDCFAPPASRATGKTPNGGIVVRWKASFSALSQVRGNLDYLRLTVSRRRTSRTRKKKYNVLCISFCVSRSPRGQSNVELELFISKERKTPTMFVGDSELSFACAPSLLTRRSPLSKVSPRWMVNL